MSPEVGPPQPQRSQEDAWSEARILSDAEFIKDGAEIRGGQLYLTSDQIDQIQADHRAASPELPEHLHSPAEQREQLDPAAEWASKIDESGSFLSAKFDPRWFDPDAQLGSANDFSTLNRAGGTNDRHLGRIRRVSGVTDVANHLYQYGQKNAANVHPANFLIEGQTTVKARTIFAYGQWSDHRYAIDARGSDTPITYYFTLPRTDAEAFTRAVAESPDLLEGIFRHQFGELLEAGLTRTQAEALYLVDARDLSGTPSIGEVESCLASAKAYQYQVPVGETTRKDQWEPIS